MKTLKKITKVVLAILVCVSLAALCSESDNFTYQVIWTLSWFAVFVLSGWSLSKLLNTEEDGQEV